MNTKHASDAVSRIIFVPKSTSESVDAVSSPLKNHLILIAHNTT